MAEVLVVSTGDRFTQQIIAGEQQEHRWLSDEPGRYGGKNAGSNPYELLLGSLGSCMAITLRMYAGRKGWPLEGTRIRLAYDRIHARDCDDVDSPYGFIHRIERRIELLGPLSGEQKARLSEIAAQCPIHKTLTGDLRIVDAGRS